MLACATVLAACGARAVPNTVNDEADLYGAKIGVVTGSAASVYAAPYGTMTMYLAAETMLVEVKNAVIDCAVMDEGLAKSTIKQVSGLKILRDPLAEDDFRFAIAHENPDLAEAVNASLDALREDETLQNIIDGYMLGTDYKYTSPEDVDRSNGTLMLAVDGSFPPYSFDNGAGRIVGIDIDVARAVCDRLGVELEVTVVDRGDLVKTVQFGKADFSLGGITENEADAELVSFSEPYTHCIQVIVTRK